MSEPLGFLLTWRTYGTWLHGDPRGSVDWEHNVYGTELLTPCAVRARQAYARMRHPAVALSDAARQLVTSVIVDHCRIRRWELWERAVRTNHVHVVVAYVGLRPDVMMAQLKAYATRALRGAGLTDPRAPLWAEGGSTRYLWTPDQLNGACAYVRDGQDVPR
jgi:REP element-mobilizing transposase RayT